MTAADKLSAINEALAAGKTVYIGTMTKVVKLTAKVAAKWVAYGKPVVKVSGDSLYLASGKSYFCADYCDIRVEA